MTGFPCKRVDLLGIVGVGYFLHFGLERERERERGGGGFGTLSITQHGLYIGFNLV